MTPPIAALYLKTIVSIEDEGSMTPVAESVVLDDIATMHVITAWNPGDERPTPSENHAANRALFEELATRGIMPIRAIGADPNSPHFEESWAVVGLTDDEARSIGASYGQIAVFKFSNRSQTVLGCFEDWSASRPL